MKKFWLITLALATALSAAPLAKGDTFNFCCINISANSGSGSQGTITGTGSIDFQTVGGVMEIDSASFSFTDASNNFIGLGNLIADPTPGEVYYDDLGPSTPGFGTSQPPNSENYIYYDNVLTSTTTASPIFDGNGILLQITNGNTNVGVMNFFYEDGSYYYVEYGGDGWITMPNNDSDINIPANMSISPEPPSLSLLGTGLLALAGILIWKAKAGLVWAA